MNASICHKVTILTFWGLFLGLVVQPALAANFKSENTRITFIETWQGNEVFVATAEGTKTNPVNCSYPEQYVMKSSASDMSRSVLMSAYAADKKVTLTISADECLGNRPLIVAVRLQEL